MKFAFLITALLATSPKLVSACRPKDRVIWCYYGDNCDGGYYIVTVPEGTPFNIDVCFTGNPEGKILPRKLRVGPGPLGGGASCACVDNGVDYCARPIWKDSDGDKVAVKRRLLEPEDSPYDDDYDKVLWIGGAFGEPHIKTWNGTWYDWHGECDAVLVDAPNFAGGAGLVIHARTKIRYDYSFIESAAVQIGNDILEVSSFGQYMLNGVSNVDLPAGVSDFSLSHKVVNEMDHEFEVDLGDGGFLTVKTHKDIVSVGFSVVGSASWGFDKWFGKSKGLMGSYETGKLLARDGVTVIDEPNAFGQEWQVRDSDPKLFQNQDRRPQFPEQCRLPSPEAKETRRRLGESVSMEAAEEACAMWMTKDSKERCIYDVMATADLSMAIAGTY